LPVPVRVTAVALVGVLNAGHGVSLSSAVVDTALRGVVIKLGGLRVRKDAVDRVNCTRRVERPANGKSGDVGRSCGRCVNLHAITSAACRIGITRARHCE
jgi:hypothetical protein